MSVYIRMSRNGDNRLKLIFPYNPVYIAEIKTIWGSRWHPEEKCWSVPYSAGLVEKLQSIFEKEDDVKFDPFVYWSFVTTTYAKTYNTFIFHGL